MNTRHKEEEEEEEEEDDQHLSPAEKRQLKAEKRAAWRQARLRSLENVSVMLMLYNDH